MEDWDALSDVSDEFLDGIEQAIQYPAEVQLTVSQRIEIAVTEPRLTENPSLRETKSPDVCELYSGFESGDDFDVEDDDDEELADPTALSEEDHENDEQLIDDNTMDENNNSYFVPLSAPSVDWTWTPGDSFTPTINPFEDFPDPWNFELPPNRRLTPLELFRKTFSEEALELCVSESNKYAAEMMVISVRQTTRMKKWVPITQDEFLKFLAVRMIMGINPKPHQHHYWKKDLLLGMPIISKILSSDRFFQILQCLHFTDNDEQIPGDRLNKNKKV